MAVLTKKEFYDSQYAPKANWNKYFYGNPSHFSSANAPVDYNAFLEGQSTYNGNWNGQNKTAPMAATDKNGMLRDFDNAYQEYKDTAKDTEQKESLAQIQSKENTYNSLAAQIAALYGGGAMGAGAPQGGAAGQQFNQALTQLSAGRNYGSSDLGTMLNFQVSDKQIVDDYNNSKLSSLNNVIERGNTQIAGITESLNTANKLLADLPAGSAQRTSSEAFIKQLNDDLKSVTSAITDAQGMQKNFTPITADSPEALKEITSFRTFAQLPEERASQQLFQIDPDSYQTSAALGQKYREMATAPIGQTQNAQTEAFRAELEKGYRDYSTSAIGATTTPETEALRQRIEGEAMAQLSLGAQLGAEEQRAYQQAARGAQTARGNIFGVAPAVEEAVTTGAAGEQRKLARYGAASQFLSSGQTTGDALARDVQLRNALQQSKLGTGGQFLTSGQTMSDALRGDIAFRDALQQNRLGAAANFIGGGPSIYNLSQARTGQQQAAFQNYIQANQALPGGFNQQPSTAANFYQTVDQQIPVQLTNAFNQLYRSQADYGASTYGAQVGAISRQPNGFQNFATLAGGVKDLAGAAGGLASAGILCWVAREVYGIDNPKWMQFREWMLTKASDNLRNFYIKYGERIAESIRNKPKIKAIIRKWMDSKIG